MAESPELSQKDNIWTGRFMAMGCPCEILIAGADEALAQQLSTLAMQEALRIEHKFSRYRSDNIIHTINHAEGQAVNVDTETARLLDFADTCYKLSEGKFDVTSGILGKIWRFDGSDHIPEQKDIDAILKKVGWHNVIWNSPVIQLQPGMQIDLGGIGKEYAVDQTAAILHQQTGLPFLVNYGGDIFANKPITEQRPWIIGIDDPENTGTKQIGEIRLNQGGLATSGDARRYLLKNGIRYSHILDPTTGWPVPDAPHSVSVVANTCIEAGMFSTFAMLQGKQAEAFLNNQGLVYYCL